MAKAKISPRERMRSFMKRNNWTQEQLSAALGADRAMVSRWLAGKGRPSLDWACRIEKTLGIPVESWRDAA